MDDSNSDSRESQTEYSPVCSAEGTFEEPLVADAALTLDEQAPAARTRLLSGPLRQAVLWLALPVLMEQFINFLVGTCDIWLAGHLETPEQSTWAVNAVGLAAYVGWLASMLFSLVGAGTTALVARYWGAGEFSRANHVANCSIALSGIAGVAFLVVIWPLAPQFPAQLRLGPEASAIAIRYLRYDAFGLVFAAISLVAAAALRGTGDMRTPMIALGSVSLINLVVSAALVYGWGPLPKLGVDGIVAGTVVARVSGGLLLLASMLHPRSHLRLVAAELVPRGDVVRRILRIGLPAAGDGAILWSGHFLFLKIVGWMGEVPLATHMIGIRVEAITYLPAVAWGAAAATMVGQSLGNRDPDRARRAGHEAVRQCSLLGIVITLVFCLAPGAIFGEMHTDPAVVDMGARAFPIVALLQIPLMIGIIYAASLRGAGDTRFPLLMTAVSTYGVRLPVAWLLGIHFELGLLGAWIAMSCDMGLRAVLAALRFTGGRWSRTEV